MRRRQLYYNPQKIGATVTAERCTHCENGQMEGTAEKEIAHQKVIMQLNLGRSWVQIRSGLLQDFVGTVQQFRGEDHAFSASFQSFSWTIEVGSFQVDHWSVSTLYSWLMKFKESQPIVNFFYWGNQFVILSLRYRRGGQVYRLFCFANLIRWFTSDLWR